MPEVAVLLPVRDAERYVATALRSCLKQDVTDIEVVVVDDGSVDQSLDEVCRMADKRVRVISGGGEGVAAALRQGLAAVSAPFVARMDADDVMLPGRLRRQLARMRERPRLALIGGRLRTLSAGGRWQPTLHPRLPSTPDGCRLHLGIANCFAHPTVLFRRSAVEETGGYNPDSVFEDYDLWMRIARDFEVENLDEHVLEYRWHSRNTYQARRLEGAAQLVPRVAEYNREFLGLPVSERAVHVLLAPSIVQTNDSVAREEARAHLRAVLDAARHQALPNSDRLALRKRVGSLAAQIAVPALIRDPGAMLRSPRGLSNLPRLAAVHTARRVIR